MVLLDLTAILFETRSNTHHIDEEGIITSITITNIPINMKMTINMLTSIFMSSHMNTNIAQNINMYTSMNTIMNTTTITNIKRTMHTKETPGDDRARKMTIWTGDRTCLQTLNQ